MAEFALFETISFDSDGSKRKELSPQHYIEKYQLHLYVKDAVRLLLGRRDERPIPTVYEYFKSIITGSNVHCREYAYVYATQRNRLAFILHLDECYPHLSDSERLTPNDYHQLLCIVCSDFPKSMVDEALNGLEEEDYTYGTISKMVMLYFFYHDFFKEMRCIFNVMASTNRHTRSVAKPTTVSVGEYITAVRIICYKTDDISATSTIVLALADSKNRPRPIFTVFPPVHAVSAAIFLAQAPMSAINQKLLERQEAKQQQLKHASSKEHVSASPNKSLNQIVADELLKNKSGDSAKDDMTNEKQMEGWDNKQITWSEMLLSILKQDVLLRQLKSK